MILSDLMPYYMTSSHCQREREKGEIERRKLNEKVKCTSIAVMLPTWTLMTAVWMRSKPEPETTMFLPPLERSWKSKNKAQALKQTLNKRSACGAASQSPQLRVSRHPFFWFAPWVIFTRDEKKNKLVQPPRSLICCLLFHLAPLIVVTHPHLH